MDAYLTKQIGEYFATQPVLKAWVFGSYARGEQREDSDIDIMIVPTQRLPGGIMREYGIFWYTSISMWMKKLYLRYSIRKYLN